jgi:hypothetical protein
MRSASGDIYLPITGVNAQFVTHVCHPSFAVHLFSYRASDRRRTFRAMLTGPRLLAVAVFYVAISLLQLRCAAPSKPEIELPPVAALAPDDALTDAQPGQIPARKVPRKPYDWQKKPTGKPPQCGPKEREIFGACYRRAHPDDYSPPCEVPTVEHEGTCYYAVQAPKREPSSVER